MSQLEQNIDDFADPRFSFWHNTLDWVSCDSPAPLSEDWVENETYVSPYIDQTSTEYRWNVMEHRQNTEGTKAPKEVFSPFSFTQQTYCGRGYA